ncbi:osteocalcin isoform X2 [Rhinoderma darwinii]|uniref:osteocalcin isoform X2 n=1 Tax=Rhinoderma darwinii TaxID=43563 RepID=UPI003F668A94
MKTLIVLSLLGMMACCLALEEVMISRSSANAVVKRHRRSYDYFERLFPRVKSPLEMKMEQCEEYRPCDQLSEWVGFHQAYRRYFGPV